MISRDLFGCNQCDAGTTESIIFVSYLSFSKFQVFREFSFLAFHFILYKMMLYEIHIAQIENQYPSNSRSQHMQWKRNPT